jgi:Phosphatidate cytidylyltransferase, mitochondrial
MSSDNYSHYSYIAKRLPLDITNSVQMGGTGLYFNPLIPLKNFKGIDFADDTRKIKYGVIEIGKAIDDLQNWETFGLAGRL